ncbi:putative HTH-type transcriptional regulator YulB [Labeo rohita]|uniref:HTH-type transcriptional regulator YulB n=1 Tax=Labeo rohita TaxID=84645 RepID=A0ABQ8LAS8_LABRO|nr:putative HTH-type transcriptional regulator YulB [Labeo rohita]
METQHQEKCFLYCPGKNVFRGCTDSILLWAQLSPTRVESILNTRRYFRLGQKATLHTFRKF